MKVELNGKSIIAIICLSSSIALSQFVSVVNANNNGGVSITDVTIPDDQIEPLIEQKLLERFPIGSVTMRMDSIDPSDIYGGLWELINEDATVSFGDGSNQSGIVIGENNPVVPIPAHSHNATQESHSHDRGSMNITGHFGNGFYGEFSSAGANGAFYRGSSAGATKYTHETWVTNGPNIQFNAANTWTGSTSSVSPAIIVEESGVENPTIDVRGSRVAINIWKRIN